MNPYSIMKSVVLEGLRPDLSFLPADCPKMVINSKLKLKKYEKNELSLIFITFIAKRINDEMLGCKPR